ncbi:MAG: hypothetical protein ABH865_09205 [Candidatus Omnitrophota bacterium]|nr:hypothetical protein [Candidatus Omnitrophota bacterium]
MRVLLFSILFFLASLPVFAHSPEAVTISAEGAMVAVIVEHQVADPRGHYIKRIEISLNGRHIIVQEFSLQGSNTQQKAVYEIPGLKKGDILAVDADCNKGGDRSAKIEVP